MTDSENDISSLPVPALEEEHSDLSLLKTSGFGTGKYANMGFGRPGLKGEELFYAVTVANIRINAMATMGIHYDVEEVCYSPITFMQTAKGTPVYYVEETQAVIGFYMIGAMRWGTYYDNGKDNLFFMQSAFMSTDVYNSAMETIDSNQWAYMATDRYERTETTPISDVRVAMFSPILSANWTEKERISIALFFNMLATRTSFELNVVRLDVSIPPGSKLILDSATFSALVQHRSVSLEDQVDNVLHLYNGPWIFVSTESVEISMNIIGSDHAATITYDERWL